MKKPLQTKKLDNKGVRFVVKRWYEGEPKQLTPDI